MLNIYAQTFMTASRQRHSTPVHVKGRRWWQLPARKYVDMTKL